jgi:hypothetical protein
VALQRRQRTSQAGTCKVKKIWEKTKLKK